MRVAFSELGRGQRGHGVVGDSGKTAHTGINSTPNSGASGSGAAFVFVRNAGAWSQQAYVKPAAFGTSQTFDNFGWSVALSGDTLVVGAVGEDSSSLGIDSAPNESASAAGAAYVFSRSAGVWSQQAYLKPAAVGTTQASDNFGWPWRERGQLWWEHTSKTALPPGHQQRAQ
jgi:hypothetical protein